MSKRAAATAPPLPMGFRFDSELSVVANARAAYDQQSVVYHAQMESNARVMIRRTFPSVDSAEIEFKYYPAPYPDVPTFVIDDELFAFNANRKELALIDICVGCQKTWNWRGFLGLADLGRELAQRDAKNEPFTCRMCEMTSKAVGQ